ncbi:MAG TPA: HNH endonuclease [Mucilaginibacter sp.]|nr:HNH endonuclease [Mucilaginibacter sp.]
MRLNDTEAAYHLGITKELLFNYTKSGLKGVKLSVHEDSGNRFFDEADLDNWDAFLKEPWSENEGGPRHIPRAVKDYLNIECGGKCARCGNGHRLENAHIDPWAISRSHHPHNLIRLCGDCHVKFDDGIISTDEIRRLKTHLINQIKRSLLPSVPASCRPPQPDIGFVGRELELETIVKKLPDCRLVVVQGVGGIGKTQLILHLVQGYQQPVYFFRVDRYAVFHDFRTQLLQIFSCGNTEQLITELESIDRLLIFDGLEQLLFHENDKVVDLLQELLQQTSRLKIIISSQIVFRHPPVASAVVDLMGLESSESKLCLSGKQSIDTTSKDLDKLIQYAEGHPLTLKIMAGLIDFYRTPKAVWEQIRQSGAVQIKDPLRQAQNKSSSLTVCLEIAFKQLTIQQQTLLQYLGAFKDGYRFSVTEIDDPTLGLVKAENAANAAQLRRFRFIFSTDDIWQLEKIEMLNPIREFLKAVPGQDKRQYHTIKIAAYTASMVSSAHIYQDYLLSDKVEFGLLLYDLEFKNYLDAFRACVHAAYCPKCQKDSDREKYLTLITNFAYTLYKYLFTRGFIQLGIYVNSEGAKAHMELKEYEEAIDDWGQVIALYTRIGQPKQAEEIFKQVKICEANLKNGANNPYVYLLEAEMIQKADPEGAIKLLEKGIEIYQHRLILEPDSETDLGNLGNLKNEIGRIYERLLGRPALALPYYHEGYKLQKKIKDYPNLYSVAHHMGNCYRETDLNKSLKYYQEALLGFIQLGQQQYIGNTVSALGALKVKKPEVDLHHFFTPAIVEAGLTDIASELLNELGPFKGITGDELDAKLGFDLLKKIFLVIQFATFSDEGQVLYDWAVNLKSKLPEGKYYLSTFLEIGLETGQMIKNEQIEKDDMMKLYVLCFMSGHPQQHKHFKPFAWLSSWLYFRDIRVKEDPTVLYEETRYFLKNNGLL